MSERILKALMHLFAIIAIPQSNVKDSRNVVKSFLDRQLNRELVDEYLALFDDYYKKYQEAHSKRKRKSIALSSVKVLKICTTINEELTQKQKVVVLIRLFEFVRAENENISEQELEFIETVSSTFNVSQEEYIRLKGFVLYPFNKIPNSTKILIINNDKLYAHPKTKHLYSEFLRGQIRVFNMEFVSMYLIRYIGDTEVYLNGQLIRQSRVNVLTPGSSIRNPKIKPIFYSDIVSKFISDISESKIVFDAQEVEYKFKNGGIGLHNLSFTEESFNLVGIMGASGSGKSTLLNVFNGSYKPTQGKVSINEIDIHNKNSKLEGVIGYVSQDDLLIEDLTVAQNLYFNAKLCFGNYSEKQILKTVSKTLQNLGLFEIRDMKVGSPLNKKISGGQRKRLNIGLELIREPSVLFLDEPTSGLSSRDSENIMDLLKELALKGKLVFTVIHQPSSNIFKMLDKLIILDNEGYLIYNGNPISSIIYFKEQIQQANWSESECNSCGNVNSEQIFNIVEASVVDEYGMQTTIRKKSPKEWNEDYEKYRSEKEPEKFVSNHLPENKLNSPNKFIQFSVFIRRDILSKLTNKQYLLINLLETPILAFFLAFIVKYYNVDFSASNIYVFGENSNIPVYIFMSVIIAIFVGLTVSAEEIIKDRKILKREKFLHLSRQSYLLSKVAILISLSAIQSSIFVLLGNSILGIKGMYIDYWLILFSTWCFANILGLNISDGFKTTVTIYILIPFLIIPQIILSGVIVKFDKLNPSLSSPNTIPIFGEVITARWAYEALTVNQFIENEYEKPLYLFDKAMSKANYKNTFWLKQLRNKLDFCSKNLNNEKSKDEVAESLTLFRNEISKELSINPKIPFDYINELYFEKINSKILSEISNYLDKQKTYYKKLYNLASKKRNDVIARIEQIDNTGEELLRCKQTFHNEAIENMVKNSSEPNRIIEYDGDLFQKTDPIFQMPQDKFVKAQFYAPKKQIFGKYFDTFWVNLLVIWFSILTLYLALYYSLLRKSLNYFETIFRKFQNDKK
ncbi:MAG: ATP-binding cassette domain-containing protein [Bacteroidetes bacterium]|nr:ATP-binding cassette domain-containing protein [Bacteroidota bacterium]MBT6687651.1 ATP-binding cassette domain-containing protein [Bacteroidota bacterium]MBT7142846.1 ATP-binding cassette domain-containing protein [Bacteroidota bacterium]MBT7492578.1 ATP-binding cassette domain-containing protein [Bacteroidota bacterium]